MRMSSGWYWTVVIFLSTALVTPGQESADQNNVKQGDNNSSAETAESTSDVSPGFAMNTLVREVTGRVGGQATFRFSLRSLGGTKRIQTRVVRLTQKTDGSITLDPEAESPDEVTIDTPSEVEVSADDPVSIEGTIDVTQDGGAERYYGVIVKDLGRPVDVQTQNQSTDEDGRSIRINYVTRYLLRVELTVSGAPPPNYNNLEVNNLGLRSRDGRAFVTALLQNNSNTVHEVRVRAALKQKEGRLLGRPFFLELPISSGDPAPERYEVNVIPGAEVRVERQVPEPVFSGEYKLSVEVRDRAQTLLESEEDVTVESGQFPAQDQVVSRIVRDIRVSPSHVQFSRRPEGNRVQSLSFENRSDQSVQVSVEAFRRADGEDPLSWLTIRPDSFQLGEGKRQDLFLSASTQGVESGHQYGFLDVSVEPTETTAGGSMNVPVSFLGRDEIDLKHEIGELRPESHNNQPVIEVPVTNKSNVHFEVRAEAEIKNPFGGTTSLKGGFGRWILPGETERVRFQLDKIPPSGEYPVNISLRLGHGKDPIEVERSFQIP